MDDGRPLAAVLLQVFDPARGEAAARLDRQAELRDQSDVPGNACGTACLSAAA